MTTSTRGFDTYVEQGWRDFRGWYAEALLALVDGDAMDLDDEIVTTTDPARERAGRFGVLTYRDRDTFVVWLHLDTSLDADHDADPAHHAALARAVAARGFAHRDDGRTSRGTRHERRFARARVDELAAVVVAALREDLGVQHPLLLDLTEHDWEPVRLPLDATARTVTAAPAIAWPTSAVELDRLVDVSLVPLLGDLPRRDDDGDVPIHCGEGMVWVSSHQDGTRLRLMSFLVDDVTDDDAGQAEAGRINREFDVVKARYVDGSVQLVVDVRTEPFTADVVRREVAALCGFVETFGPSVARTVGGRTWSGEPEDPDDDEPARGSGATATGRRSGPPGTRPAPEEPLTSQVESARRRLQQLDALEPGGLSAVEVAIVCEDDADVVMALVELAQQALESWCAQRDEVAPGRPGADPDEHRALEAQGEVAADWLLTTRLALKHLLLG